MPIRAVVTGGAGFIGSHVADGLLERGDTVVVVDNLSSGRRERVPAGAELRELDIRDGDALKALAVEVEPQAWFHLAAQADVRVSVADPGFDADVNVRGTAEVLEAARTTGARVVFSSTGGAIYGEVDTIPSPESTPCAAMAPYGVSKLCGEHYVELSNRLYGTNHVILRYGNVYGPRQDPHGEAGVVAIFFGKLAAGETPLVFGDGLQTRDYVYVGDVVRANLAAIGYSGSGQTFNIGTGRETNVLELLQACQHAAGTAVEPDHQPARLGELARSALDCSLAERELGWKAEVGFAEGLQLTLAELRAQMVAAEVRLRAAEPADCDDLVEITVASKASWGYPGEIIREWAEGLHISQELLDATETVVAERGGRAVAWAQLVPPVEGVAVLNHLWVVPGSMHAGIGTRLFRWAAARARGQGAATMEWESDPNAVGFYRQMGGRTVRTVRSEWGRDLPVMAIELT